MYLMMCHFHIVICIATYITICMWNWHIINPTSHHNELPPYRRKENNFIYVFMFIKIRRYSSFRVSLAS